MNNQIETREPIYVKDVYEKLQEQGCDKEEAKEMIAFTLLEEMAYSAEENRSFDEERYEQELYEMLEDSDDFEDISKIFKDENDEILQLSEIMYRYLAKNDEEGAVDTILSLWDEIKIYVKSNHYKQDSHGNTIKPEVFHVDEETGFRYDLFNLIQDMELPMLNSPRYEDAIMFFKEVVELFAWEEEEPDRYRANIGEVLNNQKKYLECNQWFEGWLKDEPGNVECINIYGLCLSLRPDIAPAVEFIEKHVNEDIECTLDNEMLFVRAGEIYRQAGDTDRAIIFEKLASKCRL